MNNKEVESEKQFIASANIAMQKGNLVSIDLFYEAIDTLVIKENDSKIYKIVQKFSKDRNFDQEACKRLSKKLVDIYNCEEDDLDNKTPLLSLKNQLKAMSPILEVAVLVILKFVSQQIKKPNNIVESTSANSIKISNNILS